MIDTMVASAWLGTRPSDRKARWEPVLQAVAWVLPFAVVAEMRFGAEVAGWGPRRRQVLAQMIDQAGVVPPLAAVTDSYVELRTWCVRAGHGLGAKEHEADRWVGAVALAGDLPLATDDSIFEDVPGLELIRPEASNHD